MRQLPSSETNSTTGGGGTRGAFGQAKTELLSIKSFGSYLAATSPTGQLVTGLVKGALKNSKIFSEGQSLLLNRTLLEVGLYFNPF